MYQTKTKSHWREFEFMFHQMQQAVEPTIALSNVIDNWGDISGSLAEASRKRRPQMEKYAMLG
jgi:hypothetical protein